MATPVNIVKADVLAIAPELALSDQAWVDVLAYVNELDLSALGETVQVTRMARIYLAAHFASMSKQASNQTVTGAAGPVVAETVGNVMRRYASSGGSSGSSGGSSPRGSGLESTFFGQMYLRIIGMTAARGPLVA